MLNTVSNDTDDSWGNNYAREIYTGAKFDGVGEEDDDRFDLATEECNQTQFPGNSTPNGHIDAEDILLHLPSHMGHSWHNGKAAKDLAKAELCLQEGQLNASLHHICIALGHKSYVFRNNVHPACMQRLKIHAWGEVHAVELTV